MKWVRPYFDCGRSNEWKFAAVVPVVDIYPRHTRFRHIEYPVYTAASVMEMNFDRIDINQVIKVVSTRTAGTRMSDLSKKCKETDALLSRPS